MTEYAIKLRDVTRSYNMCAKPSDQFCGALSPFKKSYHGVLYALRDTNVEIRKGEMIGFVEENGSRKSTMSKIVMGVLTPIFSTMEIEGKISVLLGLESGFNPEYSDYENIHLSGMVLRFSRKEVDEMVDDIVESVDIDDRIYQPVKVYLGEIFVRLTFAVVANVSSDILIMDEVLTIGDFEFQLKYMEEFTEIKDSGKTVLFVSHDTSSIRRFRDRSYWLKDEKVIEYGNTMEVAASYENFLKKKSVKTVDRSKDQAERSATPSIINVTKAELLDKDRDPVDVLGQREKLYVKITYGVKDDAVENPVLGIALRAIDSFYMYGLNTLLDDIKIPWKKGENVFYLGYKKLGLLAGEHYFDAVIFEGDATVPLIHRIRYINLFVNGSYIGEGIVVLDHRREEGTHSNGI